MPLQTDQKHRLYQALEVDRAATCHSLIERLGAHMLDPEVDKRHRQRIKDRVHNERPSILRVWKDARAQGRLVSVLGDAPLKRNKISDDQIVLAVERLLDDDYLDEEKIEAVITYVLARTE